MPLFTVLPSSCLGSLLHADLKSCLSNTVNSEINTGEPNTSAALRLSLQGPGRSLHCPVATVSHTKLSPKKPVALFLWFSLL